ncbi:hypothetical protein M3Y97_01137000 [Aphelenchoides bicaudatus]|nr:hypothetical protein M3Y97_01137000 [Aphelenchoides bicaudatus]
MKCSILLIIVCLFGVLNVANTVNCGGCSSEQDCKDPAEKWCATEHCYKTYRFGKVFAMNCVWDRKLGPMGGKPNDCVLLSNREIICACSYNMCNTEDFDISRLLLNTSIPALPVSSASASTFSKISYAVPVMIFFFH